MTWRKPGRNCARDMDRGLTAATSPWILPPDISDSICHWAHLMDDGSTQRALWITAGHIDQVDPCAHGAYDLVSSTRPAIVIDVGNTGTVLWPFLHGIGTALPQFREELAKIARRGGIETLESHYISDRRSGGTTTNRLSYKNGSEPWFMRRLKTFLRDPLTRIWETKKATELYNILRSLMVDGQSRCTPLDIVVISSPQLLRRAAEDGIRLMQHVHTLAVAETGSIIYSGNPPPSPRFYEGLFNLVLEGIYKTGDSTSDRWQTTYIYGLNITYREPFPRIWTELFELGVSSSSTPLEIGNELTIPIMFNVLHRASEDCKKMVMSLSKLPIITQSEIQTTISQDCVQVAGILQHILQIKSYKHDITVVPEEEAFSVLNLTHQILDHKLPTNDVIQDMDLFKRRAHRLLNILADSLKIFPEAIAIHGVTLLKFHPVKAGGFANIYHGTYTNTDEEQVEVALKVLKIFHDQSDDSRRAILRKFAKEALVWHYLRHPNIVPLLGVDGTTFRT
ncbi:hypothetical protein B0H13DRAFT_2380961 [Mycena leptocephala]|nr:hypothetical protein B0H13DRAFT_2380961 [Mycena leptocephala]